MPEIWVREENSVGPNPVNAAHPFPVEVIPSERTVLKAENQYGLSVTSSTVVRLTVPDSAKSAMIYVRTASVAFTKTAIPPTSSLGPQADATDFIPLYNRDELINFQVIAVSATTSLDVEYADYEVL